MVEKASTGPEQSAGRMLLQGPRQMLHVDRGVDHRALRYPFRVSKKVASARNGSADGPNDSSAW